MVQRLISEHRRRVAQRIKAARRDAELSQQGLAVSMGRSSRKWAWEVESGKKSLSGEDLARLSRVLRRPISWLLAEGPDDVDEEDLLLTGFRRLPPEGRRLLFGALEGMLQQLD